MSMHSNQPGKPELRVVDGDGEEDKESRLKRARSAVESALGLRHQTEEGPYGHLSPVPSPTGEQEPPKESAPESAADDNVTPITEAPSRRMARQIDAPGMYEGTSALDNSPVPVSADGEIDARYHRIRDARLDVETAHDDMPDPIGISQLEDLFK